MIDEHSVDVPPGDHMLMVKNDDRPGVIGIVGTLLGNAGVNIADMDVGAAADARHRRHADRPDWRGRPTTCSLSCVTRRASSRSTSLTC